MQDEKQEISSWCDRKLVTTKAFRDELYDIYKKDLDLVHEILDEGKHQPESKQKTQVEKKTKGGYWELVYSLKDDSVVLIHLKLRRYRKGGIR